jgi:hypothetical protein
MVGLAGGTVALLSFRDVGFHLNRQGSLVICDKADAGFAAWTPVTERRAVLS